MLKSKRSFSGALMLSLLFVSFVGLNTTRPARAAHLTPRGTHVVLSVFMAGGDGLFYRKTSDTGTSTDFTPITNYQGVYFEGFGAIAVEQGGNPDQLFTVASDGRIWQTYYTGGRWVNPYPITRTKGQFPEGAAITATYSGNDNVFVVGADKQIYETCFPCGPSGWNDPWAITTIPGGAIEGYDYDSHITAVNVHATAFHGTLQDVFWAKRDGSVWNVHYPCNCGTPFSPPVQMWGSGTTVAYSSISAQETPTNEQIYWYGTDGTIKETFNQDADGIWRYPYPIVQNETNGYLNPLAPTPCAFSLSVQNYTYFWTNINYVFSTVYARPSSDTAVGDPHLPYTVPAVSTYPVNNSWSGPSMMTNPNTSYIDCEVQIGSSVRWL